MKRSLSKFALIVLLAMLLLPSLPLTANASDPETIEGKVTLISPLGEKTINVRDGGLGGYINNLYFYAIGLGALLAMAVIIFGAIKYMTEGGNSFMQSEAKSWVFGGVLGLVLLISATLILTTLNKGLSDISLVDKAVQDTEDRAAGAAASNDAATRAASEKYREKIFNSRKKEVLDTVTNGLAPSPTNRPWVDPLDWTASRVIAIEYPLVNDPGARDGFIAGLEEAFEQHPELLAEYCYQKALKHESLAEDGSKPTSWYDDIGKEENNAGKALPEGCIEIMHNTHFNRRYNGALSEIDDNNLESNREELWNTFIEFSERNYVLGENFPGHYGAKEGIYRAFVNRQRAAEDSQATAQNFVDEMTTAGNGNNWLVTRVREELSSGTYPNNKEFTDY